MVESIHQNRVLLYKPELIFGQLKILRTIQRPNNPIQDPEYIAEHFFLDNQPLLPIINFDGSLNRLQKTAKVTLLGNNPISEVVRILNIDHGANHLGQYTVISFQMFFFKTKIPVQIFVMFKKDWLEYRLVCRNMPDL